jgi:hypothetical protein
MMNRLRSLESLIKRHTDNNPSEKIHIHFDKPFYLSGEDAWYKAYVTNASDLTPSDISTALNVDLIDQQGNIIKHQNLRIENGASVGDFTLDSTLAEGIYTVRAYTDRMKSKDSQEFYFKNIPIMGTRPVKRSPKEGVQNKIDLQFFPEGGNLVNGIQTQVAFKAIDQHGKGVEVNGKIFDESHKMITTFRSMHKGMGSFTFIPQSRKAYHAIVNGQMYDFPSSNDDGFVMTLSNRHEEKVIVRIQASSGYYHRSPVYLIGLSRGSVCYAAYMVMDKSSKDISVPRSQLPEGVVKFILFESEDLPRCERQVYIKKNEKVTVTVTGSKSEYSPRDSVKLQLQVADFIDKPIATTLSVSVTDDELINYNHDHGNIATDLLLQSEIKGTVEDPGWYFSQSIDDRSYPLDLVMMTHGWSRYDWQKILNAKEQTPNTTEQGITLSGRITNGSQPVANAHFTLAAPASETGFLNIYESDSLGRFFIPGLDFTDTVMFHWRVMSGKKGRAEGALIELDTLILPPVDRAGLAATPIETYDEQLESVIAAYTKSGVWTLRNAKVLNEVLITARREQIKAVSLTTIMVTPNEDDLKYSTSLFISKFTYGLSGARMITANDGSHYWVTQNGAPLSIIIDGQLQEGLGFGVTPSALLNTILVDEIDRVFIAAGTIAIITKKVVVRRDDGKTTKIKIKGYDKVREFYHPKYGPRDVSSPTPDYRSTLYWNPNVQTNSNGVAEIKFYNSDYTKKMRLVIHGISRAGLISTTTVIGRSN